MEKQKKRVCLKCSYVWDSRIEEPRVCPRCKSPHWRKGWLNRCEVCEKHFNKIYIHHKDGNKENNSQENLIVVCGSCHASIHNGIGGIGKRRKTSLRNYRNSLKHVNVNIPYEVIGRRIEKLHNFWFKKQKEDKK